MELVLSILAWVVGIFAFSILSMVMMIEMITERKSKHKNIIISVSLLLVFGLLYLGVKSIFFTSYTEVSQTHSVGVSSEKSSHIGEQTTVVSRQEKSHVDYNVGLWILYFIIFVNFYGWIFIPSKDGKNKKDVFEMRPWDPNWKPKSEKME